MGWDDSQITRDDWAKLRAGIRELVGDYNFDNWIKPLEFQAHTGEVLTLLAPTGFAGNYVSGHFVDPILAHVGRSGYAIRRIEFRTQEATTPRPVAAQPSETAHRPEQAEPADALISAPLDTRFTFDNFVVGKPNELAAAAARRVAEGGPVTFNPLFLYGGVGLGKTHLMHAIAHDLRRNKPDLTVLYLSAEQFMYRFVRAIRERKTLDFKELFRSVDVLMVDDVQFISGKESTQEEFFHTFNALVEQNKQIVISADRAPEEISGIENRIRSRLQSGLVVDLHPTDYELRLGILQSKVDAQRAHYPDVLLENGILEFLALRISSNVRVLEGALTRLFAFASLVGRPINMDLTKECLSDVLRTSQQKVSIDEIQRKVADHYNIRISDLIGPKRTRVFARPRQVAMFLCKTLTSRSLPEIARRFGGRDHTTVIHGVRKIEALRHEDAAIAEDLEILRRALEN